MSLQSKSLRLRPSSKGQAFRCSVFIQLVGLPGHISLWVATWTAPSLAFNKRMTTSLNQFAAWRHGMQTGFKTFIQVGPTAFSAGLLEVSLRTKLPLSFLDADAKFDTSRCSMLCRVGTTASQESKYSELSARVTCWN